MKSVGTRPHVRVRGIYGGVPAQVLERGLSLADLGVNAVWIGSGSLTPEAVALLRAQGAHVFAEFNTLHEAGYLADRPDAAPVGPDGEVSPPPDGWQGVCPTHPGYREYRMDALRRVLREFPIDGVWLDYHHSHASWEQAVPNLPDTCFCPGCLDRFRQDTGGRLPEGPVSAQSALLLGERRAEWTAWRCAVLTDWVREFRRILDEERPGALLGTFHCPWTQEEYEGALRDKLAIDLRAQSAFVDVFSIMPYHARFGHADDPGWISRQTAWLGQHLGIRGEPGERLRIWPIVQLSNWGEAVSVGQVPEALEHGTRAPSTGVMVFAWATLHGSWDKVEAMGEFYRAIMPEGGQG